MTTVDKPSTQSLLDELANDLQHLPDPQADALTIRRAVAQLFDDIEAAIQRGHTLETIAERFAQHGLKAGVRTLETYLNRERRKRRQQQPKPIASRSKSHSAKVTDKIIKLPVKGGETPPPSSPSAGFLEIDEDQL